MKKGFHCPKCGNFEATKILITTLKGKSISLLLASQAIINKPHTELRCLVCKHAGKNEEFRLKKK